MSDWAREKAQVMMSFFTNTEDGITIALRKARAEALEEAAQVAEYVPAAMVASADPYASRYIESNKTIAAAIRALIPSGVEPSQKDG